MCRVLLAGAALIALGLAGCQTVGLPGNAALATAGFAYSAGTATQSFPFTSNQIQTPLLESMADLKMHSVRQTQEPTGVSFQGLTADGRRASVSVSRVPTVAVGAAVPTEAAVVVTARIGWFGDEPLSRALMHRIGVRLGTSPPSAIPSEPPSKPEGEGTVIFGGRELIPPGLHRMNDGGYRDTPVP
jgi:hypothetical protein